jgi:hypothetical protein
MLVKINDKPIKVEEKEEIPIDYIYLTIVTIGYALIFWIVDYVIFTFFLYHPFPFISWITNVIKFIF